MKKLLRLALLATVAFGCLSLAELSPANAYFQHHHKHVKHVKHRKTKHKMHSRSNAMVRDAQTSLVNLAYYRGKPDGVLGPKTVKAIKAFQHDHHLAVNGRLNKETYNAIIKADSARAMSSLPLPASALGPLPMLPIESKVDTLKAQPGLVGQTNQQYADPLLGGAVVAGEGKGAPQAVRTQELSSRFAKLDINENKNGPTRRYDMTLNGRPILQIDNQPSIIGISQTYALDNEDAIILTSYHDGDPVCAYKHYLLTLAEGRNELRAIGNCTHGYQARKVEDSLFITFPEFDDQRLAGATWRYEGGELERL